MCFVKKKKSISGLKMFSSKLLKTQQLLQKVTADMQNKEKKITKIKFF